MIKERNKGIKTAGLYLRTMDHHHRAALNGWVGCWNCSWGFNNKGNVYGISQVYSGVFCQFLLYNMYSDHCTAFKMHSIQYSDPLSVLIMDNVKIHHGEEILALVDHFGKTIISYWHFLHSILWQVFASSTFHHIPQISIPSKKHSQKLSTGFASIRSTTVQSKAMALYLICSKSWTLSHYLMPVIILFMQVTSRYMCVMATWPLF